MRRWALPGWMGTERTFRVLVLLNVLVFAAVWYAFRGQLGNDRATYLALAEGILHGDYSIWWRLGPGFPDTFRSPGYPLFLAGLLGMGGGIGVIQAVQGLLYAGAIMCLLRVITDLGGGRAAQNLFLLLLLPSIQVLYYVPAIFPEVPMVFLMALILKLTTGPARHARSTPVWLGLLFGVAFTIRPVVLFLPLLWALAFIIRRAPGAWRKAGVLAGVFLLTTVPYGLWNLRHHGVFRISPIEGGAGVLHMGWWSGRMPGYCEHRYWGNCAAVEPVQFVPTTDIPAEVAAFEREWDRIDSALAPLVTARDSTMLRAWSGQDSLFRTYSAPYTLERERLLKAAVMADARAHPGYTLAYKAYSAVRLWFTGIQMDQWKAAHGMGRIKLFYPFAITFLTFILALVATCRLWRRGKDLRRRLWPLGLALLYFGLIHVPFVIQARYTIPVRLFLLVLIALAFAPANKQAAKRT